MSRVAIYALEGGDLLRCARQAQRTGDRVVTMTSEVGGVEAARRLGSLMKRMRLGEFDSLLAPLSILGFDTEDAGEIVRIERMESGA